MNDPVIPPASKWPDAGAVPDDVVRAFIAAQSEKPVSLISNTALANFRGHNDAYLGLAAAVVAMEQKQAAAVAQAREEGAEAGMKKAWAICMAYAGEASTERDQYLREEGAEECANFIELALKDLNPSTEPGNV